MHLVAGGDRAREVLIANFTMECAQRRTSRRQDFKRISDRCLINHNLQQNVSNDVTICTACEESCLPGTNMFECITCDDMWTYCVDCKLASDLHPSYNQRQYNDQTRAPASIRALPRELRALLILAYRRCVDRCVFCWCDSTKKYGR